MAQRKGYVYRQYIHSSASSGVKVPDSTWRRWLQQGRISEEQLRELGIQPNRRRRVRRRRALPHEGIQAHARLSPMHTAEDENFEEVNDAATSEANNTSAGGEHGTSAGEDNFGGAGPIETHHSDVESVANFWSLSSFESEGDLGEQQDQVTDETDLLSSVLDSSNIGVRKLNGPLVPCLQVTKFETLLMILHLAMRHGYTDVFLEDLMYFVNELVGVKDAIPQSKFLFNKLFKFASHPDIHFFCSTCDIYLGMSTTFKENVVCHKCAKTNLTSSLNGGDYFLSLSIRNQIKDILSRPHIKLVCRENRADDIISDVVDGLLYKSLMKDGRDLISPNALTISFNTDGSPVFKSGPNSVWPIQFYLNELIPEQRFASENILVAGLWFSRSKPKMEIFLRPFIQELRDLEKNGVVWKKHDGSVCESPIYAISCSVDSVAKPHIQNVIQFNGSFGCGYCLHPNRSVTVVEELDRRSGFFVSNNDSDSDVEETVLERRRKLLRYLVGETFALRTDKQLRQHKIQAENTEMVTFGAKGNSMLCSLKYFNIVHGFSVDYLHCVFLGVTRRLASLWFDSTSSREEYYIGRMIDIVDKRLADISPPSKMRYVRRISDRVHWKGNEWRGFLLYFGLPALINILPLVYVHHFQKLVTSIYIGIS